jgi:hypothetical protein
LDLPIATVAPFVLSAWQRPSGARGADKVNEMGKEQKSNKEKKKPKQDKSKKAPGAGTAYAQAKAAGKK